MFIHSRKGVHPLLFVNNDRVIRNFNLHNSSHQYTIQNVKVTIYGVIICMNGL